MLTQLVEKAQLASVQAPMPPEQLAALVWTGTSTKIRRKIQELRGYIAVENDKLKEEEKVGQEEVIRIWNEDHLEELRTITKSIMRLKGLHHVANLFDQCVTQLESSDTHPSSKMPRVWVELPHERKRWYEVHFEGPSIRTDGRWANFEEMLHLNRALRSFAIYPDERSGIYYTELTHRIEARQNALYEKVEEIAKLTRALGRGQEVIDSLVYDLIMQRLHRQEPATAEALEKYSDTVLLRIIGDN